VELSEEASAGNRGADEGDANSGQSTAPLRILKIIFSISFRSLIAGIRGGFRR
jgi:hypothetical protein